MVYEISNTCVYAIYRYVICIFMYFSCICDTSLIPQRAIISNEGSTDFVSFLSKKYCFYSIYIRFYTKFIDFVDMGSEIVFLLPCVYKYIVIINHFRFQNRNSSLKMFVFAINLLYDSRLLFIN